MGALRGGRFPVGAKGHARPTARSELDAEYLVQLDLVPLHKLLLEKCLGLDAQAIQEKKNIYYIRETEEAIGLVDGGEAQVAFLVNATKLSQVRDLALNGEVLPQKSTDFYPKVLSGLTLYNLDRP